MGYTPRQVDEMTLWEFECCFDAHQKQNGKSKKSGNGDIDDHRLREMGIEGFNGD